MKFKKSKGKADGQPTLQEDEKTPPLSWAAENVPYILAALLGLVTWSLTHATDRLLQSPIVAYSIVQEWDPKNATISLELVNLARTIRFHDVTFVMQVPKGTSKIVDAKQHPHAPMLLERSAEEEDKHTAESATFFVPELQPGWRDNLTIRLTGAAVPALYVNSPEPLNLVPASAETFILEHELALLLALAIMASLLSSAYVFHMVRRYSRT